ncbi:MAG: endonuclease/exonuclease/phosphatase family protein [Phaeodactylibacter sp.]|nr:endonuclease/exonuclease/phosphatase family protein [Phaeodactylibacter sp.]MCB9276481.1 endonuclease/exonuclease/phosphatase family protein [Lewinellaceae bacterium]
MPWYNDLRPAEDLRKQEFGLIFPDMTDAERANIIQNLLRLRPYLDQTIARKRSDQNLLIASWNIKEFGQLQERIPESYFYIAEIISKFDLVAIQEVKNTLKDLQILMRLLGDNWGYLINDITEGVAGNSERFAFVFDKRRVEFSGLAGEIVLWDELTGNRSLKQLKRTPYITGFTAGWKTFAIINVHLNPDNSEAAQNVRRQEIEALVRVLQEKLRKKSLWTENLMLMGDFNLYSDPSNQEMAGLLLNFGFKELSALAGKPTNVSGTQAYDKLYFRENRYFQVPGDGRGGVLKFFESVYREEDYALYKSYMLKHKGDPSSLVDESDFKSYFERYWRRYQVSDHYPVWMEILIDSSDEFLQEKLEALVAMQ